MITRPANKVALVSLTVLLWGCRSGDQSNNGPHAAPAEEQGSASSSEGLARRPTPSSDRGENPFAANESGSPIELLLKSRTVKPKKGISEDAVETADEALSAGGEFIRVYAQRSSVPSLDEWQSIHQGGLTIEQYVNHLTWIVRVPLGEDADSTLQRVEDEFAALSVFTIEASDKADPKLVEGDVPEWGMDESGNYRVVVSRFSSADPQVLNDWSDRYQVDSSEADFLDEMNVALVIAPESLSQLLQEDDVEWVEAGPTPENPLMEDVTHFTGAARTQDLTSMGPPPTYAGYTGDGVVVSNNEGLDPGHDDFWSHDAGGNRTAPRWIGCQNGNGGHGTMTAGIMMGNGFRSAESGAAPLAFRGMAPEATFGCVYQADVSNWSFAHSSGDYNSTMRSQDQRIHGDSGDQFFHPHVGAAANQGLSIQYYNELAYYSVYRPSKNEIVVANMSSHDWRWNGSSLGPTWDGRIKPDLAAMGGAHKWPDDTSEIPVELDYVAISGPNARTWSFDDTNGSWAGGFGENGWWDRQNISNIEQSTDGSTHSFAFDINPKPWGSAWSNRPKVGTQTEPDGTTALSFTGSSSDVLSFRYRLPSVPLWTGSPVHVVFAEANDPGTSEDERYYGKSMPVALIADGDWHVATVPVGTHVASGAPGWNGVDIGFLHFRFDGPINEVPSYGSQGYGGSSGSSAAAPVVAGGIAQLMHQVVELFGVNLDTRTNSPFAIDAPGTGAPLPSTYKALLVQTARDLASIPSRTTDINGDTGEPTVYHPGPDLATGYGMLDIATASEYITEESNGQSVGAPPLIIERELSTVAGDAYDIQVLPGQHELKVTLAWDDPASSTSSPDTEPKLVNNLDLLLKGPDGLYYLPWSLQQPYEPDASNAPGVMEPEPITAADIVAARRDRPNNRDNVEQVVVSNPPEGVWKVYVLPGGLALPPQNYSLVLPKDGDELLLQSGTVAFSSDRNGQKDIFVKDLTAGTPPLQISSSSWTWNKGEPEISPDGTKVAFVIRDYPGTPHRDVVLILGASGGLQSVIWSNSLGYDYVRYPHWSPNSDKLLVTVFDTWGDRGLLTLNLNVSPTSTSLASTTLTVPLGVAPDAPDPANGIFSPDGKFIYFRADSNQYTGAIFRANSDGTGMERIWGNNSAIHYAFNPTISPDGSSLLINSEMYRQDPEQYLDEELLEVGVHTGIVKQVTRAPGNEYAHYAWGGSGEYIVRSADSVGGKQDLFVAIGNRRVKLDLGDPSNVSNESGGSWSKN